MTVPEDPCFGAETAAAEGKEKWRVKAHGEHVEHETIIGV